MTLKYVVAGTSPPAWFSKAPHILLREAVATQWAATITDPPITYINFNNTWFSDSSDFEFNFLHLRDDHNPNRRSTDWNRRNTTTFVDVHLWVKGSSIDEEPPWLYKAKVAFESIIELNNSTLIPNTVITIENDNYIEEKDHLQTIYHWLFSVRINYDKVKVDV